MDEERVKKEQLEKEAREHEMRRRAILQEEKNKYEPTRKPGNSKKGQDKKNAQGTKNEKEKQEEPRKEANEVVQSEKEVADSGDDLERWEDVVRMALHIQRASVSIHSFLAALDIDKFVHLYRDRFAVFTPNTDQVYPLPPHPSNPHLTHTHVV